jgi:hypothetical protein
MSDVLYDLHAEHHRTNPVFVIGYARSGTSLVCRLMRRYLKVSFGTESQFILRYLGLLPAYGDLAVDANVRRLLEDIGGERFFARSLNNWGFRYDPARAFDELRGRTFRHVLDAVFGQLASHNGMVRWGDKTPSYNDNLFALYQLFPDALFIHAVRDGRDVALSIRQTSFGPKNACECAQHWAHTQQTIRNFAAALPPDQFHQVRYEDLTANPLETMQSLGAFLGVEVDGAVVSAMCTGLPSDVRAGNTGKWQRTMQPRELERFEGVAAHSLVAAGYPLGLQGHARRIGPVERWSWRVHGHAIRLARGDAWRDSMYRLGLRATTLGRQLSIVPRLRSSRATMATGHGHAATGKSPG